MSKTSCFLFVPVVLSLLAAAGCSGDDPPASGSNGGGAGTPGNAGSSSGGTSALGGGSGTGGTAPTAGMNSTGGSGGSVGSAGKAGAGGSSGSGGSSGAAATGGTGASGGTAGSEASGGLGGSSAMAGASGATAGSAGSAGTAGGGGVDLDPFSFFVTSFAAMEALAGTDLGFGGDFRFGETGPGAGLRGADKICATIADRSMPGASAKGWRAFLSATADENGEPVNAIDRVGEGPWYDRLGRIVAMNKAALQSARPMGAHEDIVDDLPNEDGVPNHRPDPNEDEVDNHHVLTGSDTDGTLLSMNMGATCNDWTSAEGSTGRPRTGLSWPRNLGGGGPGGGMGTAGSHWISALDEAGCAPGYTLDQIGGPDLNNPTVGSGGGYGAIYCFALEE